MPNPSQADRSRDLAELQSLSLEVQSATDLQRVKQIFYRVQEILQVHPGDSAIQNAGADLKQFTLLKGKRIQEAQAAGITPPPPPPGPGTYVVDPAADRTQPAIQSPLPPPPPVLPANSGAVPVAQQSPKFEPPPAPPPPPVSNRVENVVAPAPTLPPPAPPTPSRGIGWKGPVFGGAVLAIALFGGAVLMLNRKEQPKTIGGQDTVVPTGMANLEVHTTPPGAAIRLNGIVRGKADSGVMPERSGTYELEAVLDGYEPARTNITLEAGKTQTVSLTLGTLGQTVQFYTDLDTGTVTLDDGQPKELQSGVATLEKVPAGEHTATVRGPKGEAVIGFTVAQNQPAVIKAPIRTKNTLAILLTGNGNDAKIYTSSPTPLRVAIDGQDKGTVGAQGLDLNGVPAGDHELTLFQSPTPMKLQVHFGGATSLATYLKLDINAGTLVVATGENNVKVFLDGKEQRTTTKNGQLRLPGLPVKAYMIRVSREGYQQEPEQQVKIKKGEESRVEFKLKPLPKVATLQLRGLRPGAQVFLDTDQIGTILADGTYASNSIPPGEHSIELRMDKFAPRKVTKRFEAGKTVEIPPAELALQAVPGKLSISVSPSSSTITIQGPGDAQPKPLRDTLVNLPDGTYTLTAEAPGYTKRTATVQIASGQTRNLDLSLQPQQVAQPTAAGMADWVDPKGWSQKDDLMVRRGGNFVLFKPTPTTGTFNFTIGLVKSTKVFGTRPIQWMLNYESSKSYILYQLDKKFITRKLVANGEARQLSKEAHGMGDKPPYAIRIDVTESGISTKVKKGGGFAEIDNYTDPPANFQKGRFGFRVEGDDELGLQNFSFQPK